MNNDHVHPVFAGILANAAKAAKPKPCRCERLGFPHRRAWQCDAFEDHALDGHDIDRELLESDNASRARDCNAEARGGYL